MGKRDKKKKSLWSVVYAKIEVPETAVTRLRTGTHFY